jgi:hypothetical protein
MHPAPAPGGQADAEPLVQNEHVSWRGARHLNHPGPRHSPEWYDQSNEATVLTAGDRMFIACEGGPCQSRLEMFPPRLEVEEREGIYVLMDDGPRDQWRYIFIAREA